MCFICLMKTSTQIQVSCRKKWELRKGNLSVEYSQGCIVPFCIKCIQYLLDPRITYSSIIVSSAEKVMVIGLLVISILTLLPVRMTKGSSGMRDDTKLQLEDRSESAGSSIMCSCYILVE